MKRCAFLLLFALPACVGPEASDAAVCQDFIDRICQPPICFNASAALTLPADEMGCENTLLARTGCDSPDFAFGGITRERFLSCRLPLLNAGSASNTPPNCDDVQDIIMDCPDVIQFMNGGGQ